MAEFEVDEGVDQAIEAIGQMLVSKQKPLIVEIAGGAGSGKSTVVADKIRAAFGASATTLPLDDYFKGSKFVEEERKKGHEMNRDTPEYVDLEKLSQDISALKKKQQIQKPVFDYEKSTRTGYAPFAPKSIIIIEGLFALHDKIRGSGDLHIFVEASREERRNRILARGRFMDGMSEKDELKYFDEVLEPMHQKHVAPAKAHADIVIRN